MSSQEDTKLRVQNNKMPVTGTVAQRPLTNPAVNKMIERALINLKSSS